MPRYYLLVDNRPVKSSAALDQLKEFALTTFSSTSSNLEIQEFGNRNYPHSSFHRYHRISAEWVRSDE